MVATTAPLLRPSTIYIISFMGLNFLIINNLEFPNDFMLAKIVYRFKTGINYNKITGTIAQIYLLMFVQNCY